MTATLRDAADSVVIAGANLRTGTIASTEAVDTTSIGATGVRTAAIAALESADFAAIAGRNTARATIAVAESADSAAIAGAVTNLKLASLQIPQWNDTVDIDAATNDFAMRRSSPGVFRSFSLQQAADLGYNYSNSALPVGVGYGYASGNQSTPSIDVGRGLRFTTPPFSDARGAGEWSAKFNDAESLTFGANQSLYFQWAMEQDGLYSQGSPAATGLGIKIVYVGDGNLGSTNEMNLIYASYTNSGMPFMTGDASVGQAVLGPYDAGIGQNDLQLNDTYPYDTGYRIPTNRKIWFQVGIQFREAVPGGYNARITGWVTDNGVTTKINEWDTQFAHQFPFDTGTNSVLSRLSFNPYQTSKDVTSNQGGVTYNTWISEAIFSTQRIPDPGTTTLKPPWYSNVLKYSITNIGTTTNTQSAAFIAAGYNLSGWQGDNGPVADNLTAWGGGVYVPTLGQAGSMCVSCNGHEGEPASTISALDVWNATWSIIGPPQLHRQVSPTYAAPPAEAEVWWNPDKVGVTDMTNFAYTSPTAGALTGDSAIWVRHAETGVGVATPYAVGTYSHPSYPHTYGLRYRANVGSSMRYGGYVFVPGAYLPESATESAGAIVYPANGVSHITQGDYQNINMWAWRFGCLSKTWLAHSTNRADAVTNPGFSVQNNAAHSEKYNKIFCTAQRFNHLGCFDVATNAFINVDCAVVYGHFPDESNAIVTHGHASHLYITTGATFGGGVNGRMLLVADLDAVMAGSTILYGVTNTGVVDGLNGTLPLLTPAMDLYAGDTPVTPKGGISLAWFRGRQKLVIFKAPRGISDGAPPPYYPTNDRIAPIDPGLIHIVTIPTGSTGGVPNWKTQPWVTQTVTLTLGTGTTGVHTGKIGACYGRFAALEALDLCLYLGAPDEGLQAQVFDVFGVGA